MTSGRWLVAGGWRATAHPGGSPPVAAQLERAPHPDLVVSGVLVIAELALGVAPGLGAALARLEAVVVGENLAQAFAAASLFNTE